MGKSNFTFFHQKLINAHLTDFTHRKSYTYPQSVDLLIRPLNTLTKPYCDVGKYGISPINILHRKLST